MGPVAIKLYDKFGLIGRVECTANDVTFFKHRRTVEHRDGTAAFKLAPMRKSIYSLSALHSLIRAATHRYLDFLAFIDDPGTGLRSLEKISNPVRHGDRSYRGFNLFHGADLDLFQAIIRGEFTISGFQARTLRPCLRRNCLVCSSGFAPTDSSRRLDAATSITSPLLAAQSPRPPSSSESWLSFQPSISQFPGDLQIFIIR